MSILDEARMPSLKDKIREQAIEVTKNLEVEEEEVKVKKGRRLNK